MNRGGIAAACLTLFLLAGGIRAQQEQSIEEKVQEIWPRLALPEEKGYQAAVDLVALGDEALGPLAKIIRQQAIFDADRAQALIQQLDDRSYRKRIAATEGLQQMGRNVAPMLRKALAAGPSQEAKVRIELILSKLDKAKPSPEYTRRTENISIALAKLVSLKSLKTAIVLSETIPFENLQEQVRSGTVVSVALKLFTKGLQQGDQLLAQRQRAKAIEQFDAAIELKKLVPQLVTDRALNRRRRALNLQAVEKEMASLKAKGDAESRMRLALLELAEWHDSDAARKLLTPAGDQPGALHRVLAPGPVAKLNNKSDAKLVLAAYRRAQAWAQLAQREDLGVFARTWLSGQAVEALDNVLPHLKRLESDQLPAAIKETRKARDYLLTNGQLADAVGLKNMWGVFDFSLLQTNLRSAAGNDNLPDNGEGWLYVVHWMQLGDIPMSWEWTKDMPPTPENQMKFGPIDMNSVYKIDEKKVVGWKKLTMGPSGWHDPQPARSSLWYLYTEFIADQDGVWDYAFGFDDNANLRIGIVPVFQSDWKSRSWNASEQVGKLQVKQGLNRVLIGLYNSGGGTGMSLLLRKPTK